MITVSEAERIAALATERIAKEFAEVGFFNPPKITVGIVFAVLEAAQQSARADVARRCPECRALLEPTSVYCDDCGADTPR